MNDELKSLFNKTLKEVKENNIVISNENNDINKCTSIESKQWDKCKKVKEYAIDMTEKELSQSVEGLYHNLNSLK